MGFVLFFHVRELLRGFQSPYKLELDLIVRRAKSQVHFHASGDLLGLDADDVRTTWQNVFQIHEHLRPVETAHGNDAVNESSAVAEAFDAFFIEEALQVVALLLVLGVLLAYLFRTGTDLGRGHADRVSVPSQGDKNYRGDEDEKASTGKESPVRFQRLSCQVEPNSHSLLLLHLKKQFSAAVQHPADQPFQITVGKLPRIVFDAPLRMRGAQQRFYLAVQFLF